MMADEVLKTDFASSSRAANNEIMNDVAYFDAMPMLQKCVNFIPDVFLILNRERQIVYANQILLDILGLNEPDKIYGLRPGEALCCIHANSQNGTPACGTTTFCRYCGAVNAILKSQEALNAVIIEECRIASGENETAFDFRVWARGMEFNDKPYTIFVVRDIGNEKRRSVLEKIFFHDILNTAGGIQGIMGILSDASGSELDELIHLVETASETMIEEIRVQKDLLAAETGELRLNFESVDMLEILQNVKDLYLKHEVSNKKNIMISRDAKSINLTTDRIILKRIVGNMLKNALEAVSTDGTVTMGITQLEDCVELWVHNATVMPEEVQMQMFQRSFSTKGTGRGIGTYSIKMLGEQYLKGEVSFSSTENQGTVVNIKLPM